MDSTGGFSLDSDTTAVADRLEPALSFSIDRIRTNADRFAWDEFPAGTSGDDSTFSTTTGVSSWTPGFWTGLCWLADLETDASRCRSLATSHVDLYADRLETGDVLTHDLGFLYTLGGFAAADRTGSDRARQIALRAADHLSQRFHAAPGIVQAWGDHRPDSETAGTPEYGHTIVDAMMNLPLLFRASAQTGYDHYAHVAETHARTTATYAIRDDGSTAHGIDFDVQSGSFEGQRTHQGYADDSCWSRGQAWTIYGFALAYRHTGREPFLDAAETAAEYYLAEVPREWVPPWDFRAAAGQSVRDSSAGAIAACGLLELATHVPPSDPARSRYRKAALATLGSLARSYTTEGHDSNGILTAGTANWMNDNFDQCTLWGDYFFVEGLVRALRDWTPWWARNAPA
jgi:unsaturated chondroitin disaccharide hydrolase